MNEKFDITLTINGRDYPIRVEPRKTLVDAIRDDCGQTGTHIGCEHGICGACTVILDDEAVRACLMFAVQASGKRIRTVEGLADGDTLHPLQQAFIDHHGLQCGFCTPGFLMLAVNMLERQPDIGDEDILDVLASNLCRCTGYQNIVKAVRAAAAEMRRRGQRRTPSPRLRERVGVRGRGPKLRLAETPPHPEFARRVRKFRPLPASGERFRSPAASIPSKSSFKS